MSSDRGADRISLAETDRASALEVAQDSAEQSSPGAIQEPVAAATAACPQPSQMEDLVHGRLTDGLAAPLQLHLRHCIACNNRYAALSETAPDASKPASLITKPERFEHPEMVAEFRLLRLLGQGAMGQVFAAHDTFLDRTVALKFLPSLEARAAARERFYVEARAVARIQHPNVVTLYRAGEENGRPYLVSELVRGRSLDHKKKPLDIQSVLNISLGIARGLAAAHRQGVLHRDIKPANVTAERKRMSNDPQRFEVLANGGLGNGSMNKRMWCRIVDPSAALLVFALALGGCVKTNVDPPDGSRTDMAMCVPGQYVSLCGTDCPAGTVQVCGGLHGPYVLGDTCDFPGGNCEQFDRYTYCDCAGKVVKMECKRGPTPDGGSC